MPTYEVECATCHTLKYPMAPSRPTNYVCALCTSVSPEKRLRRRQATRQGQATKRARKAK